MARVSRATLFPPWFDSPRSKSPLHSAGFHSPEISPETSASHGVTFFDGSD